MLNNLQSVASAIFLTTLITACGPSLDDAKKLGFESVNQMEVAKKAGFKNGNEYQFMRGHGFLTKDAYIQYKNSSPLEKIKMSAKNAARDLGDSYIEECYADFMVIAQNLRDRGQSFESFPNLRLVNGMMSYLKEEVISRGSTEAAFNEEVKTRFSKINSNIPFTEIENRGSECVSKFTPYFAEGDIKEFKE